MQSQLQLLLSLSFSSKKRRNIILLHSPHVVQSPLWFVCKYLEKSFLDTSENSRGLYGNAVPFHTSVLLLLIGASIACFLFYLYAQHTREVLQRTCTLLGTQVQLSDRAPMGYHTLTHGSAGRAAGDQFCSSAQVARGAQQRHSPATRQIVQSVVIP